MVKKSKVVQDEVQNLGVILETVESMCYPVPKELFSISSLVGARYVVMGVYSEGRVYSIRDIETGKDSYILYDKLQDRLEDGKESSLFKCARFHMNTLNVAIADHYSKVFHFGVDMNPEYQRDLVWSESQKISFIESCFDEQKNLGMLTYHHNGTYGEGTPLYIVIDGKQRLNALVEYRLGYFAVMGYFYKDLSNRDKNRFEDRVLPYQEIRNLTLKEQAELFLLVNDTGVPVAKEHLCKVRAEVEEGVYGN